MLQIETIAILGGGRDAVRVALLCSLGGLDVRLQEDRPEALDAAFRDLRQEVERALAAGLIGREERQRILDGILFTPELDEAAVGADLAFAAGASDAASARASLLRLARSCRATSLLATPLEPSAIAGGVPQPGRVVGLHLEDGDAPLPRLALRCGPGTTEHARGRAEQLILRLARSAGGPR
jgi:3-hydroxyacyl-CoA dehydrogenase